MKVGSLFSGIGGLDLGLERAGMTVIWQSEIDPYASRILARHWPDVPNLGDITTVDWSTVERPDVICGGYPCQPFSLAGVRRGETDPRHLWPHFADAIRHLRPRYALLENVPGHLSLGFGQVLGDLASLGYDCEWDSIPAVAVGAPHLRYRVFVVAHANSESEPSVADDERRAISGSVVPDTDSNPLRLQPIPVGRGSGTAIAGRDGENWQLADTYGPALIQTVAAQPSARATTAGRGTPKPRGQVGGGWGAWAVEPDVGRVAYGVPNRVDRVRTLGNAVVPQVAELIGRALMETTT